MIKNIKEIKSGKHVTSKTDINVEGSPEEKLTLLSERQGNMDVS